MARRARAGGRDLRTAVMDLYTGDHQDDNAAVDAAEGEGLSSSTVIMYTSFMRDYEKYLKSNPEEYAHLLLDPPARPSAEADWPTRAQLRRSKMLQFKKKPLQIDWEKFDLNSFKRWLLKKQKTKKRNSDKYPSWSRNSKSTCAVKWAFTNAKNVSNGRLRDLSVPPTLDEDMKRLKSSLGKDFNVKSELGLTDENAANELPADAYAFICCEMMCRGMFLSWAWMTFAWNNVCRHDNLKTATFDMLTVQQDNIRTNFCRTKTTSASGDFAGNKKSNPKHTFANVNKPWLCSHFAMACWLCIRATFVDPDHELDFEDDQLFGGDAAHQIFERDLKEILTDPDERVQSALRAVGVHPSMNIVSHSTRKGAATLLASSDCTGGFVVAICRRADWAINKVVDAYIKNCIGGDQTLGRIAAGLDPHVEDFEVLPPHFPLGHEHLVREGLAEIWGTSATALHNVHDHKHEALLQRLLAALVYNHDFLVGCRDRFLENTSWEARDARENTDNARWLRQDTVNTVCVQVLFRARFSSYTPEQRAHIQNAVAAQFLTRSGLGEPDIMMCSIFDAHEDLDQPALLKVCIPVKTVMSSRDLHRTRDSIATSPIRVQIEDTYIDSVCTRIREDKDANLGHLRLDPSHKIWSLAIYRNAPLLRELRNIVTIGSSNVIAAATGIPGHVALRRELAAFQNRWELRDEHRDQFEKNILEQLRTLADQLDPATFEQRMQEKVYSLVHEQLTADADARGVVTVDNLRDVVEREMKCVESASMSS
jgi:hypothetical protein